MVETTNATLGVHSTTPTSRICLEWPQLPELVVLRPGVTTYAGGSPWTQSTNNSRPDESV